MGKSRDLDFSEYFAARVQRFRRLAYAMCGDWHGAEDLVQAMFVQLYRDVRGITLRGGEISQAPPSVLDVLGGGSKSGDGAPVKGATLVEIPMNMGRVVTGCEQKTVTVFPYRAR